MPRIPAAVALILVLALAAGCGGGSGRTGGNGNFTTPVAGSSPASSALPAESPSAAPSATSSPSVSIDRPPTATGAYGVLANLFSGTKYNVTLVGVDGKVAATAEATTPVTPSCPKVGAASVPYPVSASNNAVYFMDGSGAVRWISPSGSTSKSAVITLPIGPTTRSVFAVSPDDSRIAVAVIDFAVGTATTRLFVDDLGLGGAHHQIFVESGSFTLWPVGWHAGLLVVAKVPACAQGGGAGCCGPQEYHLVDPSSAARKYTVGGTGCYVVGAPTAAGTMCESAAFTVAYVLSWTGANTFSFQILSAVQSYLSPDGDRIAVVDNAHGSGTSIQGQTFSWPHLFACGWIDDTHVLSAGDAQSQPKVGEFPSGVATPVAAQGDCAGRIPGGL